MTAITKRQCKHNLEDGSQCQAAPQNNSDYCFFHDPSKEDDRKKATSKGGKAGGKITVLQTTTVNNWRQASIPSSEEIVGLLAETIDQVRSGQLDVKVGNSVGYLAGVMLKALEYDALTERLQAIEEAIDIGKRS